MTDTKPKHTRVQVLISEPQKKFLNQTAAKQGLSLSALVRNMVESYRRQLLERELQEAAKSLYSEYQANEELTAFSSLDGEDFV